MKIENYFLRYAYPCAYILMQLKEITQEELDELEDTAINNREISRERLEKIFHNAFHHIGELAKKKNKDKWNLDIIRYYFHRYHNKIIDEKRGIYAQTPMMLNELSRVEVAKIIDKKDKVLVVEYLGKDMKMKNRNVHNSFVPQAKVGDHVTIHYGYAVEIVGTS
ncbi:MAG: hypothetical protein ABIE94_07375 [archaeon]